MPEKDLAYYLTLFKIEGHSTWRATLGGDRESFEKQMKNDHHNVTERKFFRIDRKTGQLEVSD